MAKFDLMEKIDFKKELKQFYKASAKQPELLEVPSMNFLMIDGKGNPNTSQAYSDAVEALFTLSYHLKFTIRKGEMQLDYGVMPLEGLWWVEHMSEFDPTRKDNWLWTAMIMQPDFITDHLVEASRQAVAQKKGLPALSRIRFEAFKEGKAAQILHIGPFSEEGPTIEKLHAFIEEQGMKLVGKHHEIYLSDIRRAAPERWKTVIRQPCG